MTKPQLLKEVEVLERALEMAVRLGMEEHPCQVQCGKCDCGSKKCGEILAAHFRAKARREI